MGRAVAWGCGASAGSAVHWSGASGVGGGCARCGGGDTGCDTAGGVVGWSRGGDVIGDAASGLPQVTRLVYVACLLRMAGGLEGGYIRGR